MENPKADMSKPVKVDKRILALGWLFKILDSPLSAYFCIGMGFEAMGLAIQSTIGIPGYPSIDAIIALIIGFAMLYRQKKNELDARCEAEK